MFVVLVAKQDDFNPHTITSGTALEDWLTENFKVVGPVASLAEAANVGDKEDEGEGRFWCALEMLDP